MLAVLSLPPLAHRLLSLSPRRGLYHSLRLDSGGLLMLMALDALDMFFTCV